MQNTAISATRQAISIVVACSQSLTYREQPNYDLERANKISQCLEGILPHLKNKEWATRKISILSDVIDSLSQPELTTAKRHELVRVIDEVWFLVEFADFERLT